VPQQSGTNEYAYTRLTSWLLSAGARADGVSDRLRRYAAAAEASFERRGPGWFDKFLHVKDGCSVCGENLPPRKLQPLHPLPCAARLLPSIERW
jgi:hypothetical protein